MSAVEETKSEISVSAPKATTTRPRVSPLNWTLNLLSSVRFGVLMLILLATASMIGMLIVQVNVDGFEKFYADMSPATKLLFGSLGFFDIYHAWYFNVLLLVLSLNIVLASIDRFPGAWQYIKRPKFDVQPVWLAKQPINTTLKLKGESRAEVAEQIAQAARSVGLKAVVTEKGTRTWVFMQRGTWNRLGAYAVHVALLTIFTGGFLTTQFGRTGTMPLRPGASADQMRETAFQIVDDKLAPSQVIIPLPFKVECTDIEQQLIKKDGPITSENTIDWLTRVKITDEYGSHDALVHLNHPYDYRGYRFFQASFVPRGQARHIKLRVAPEQGGEAEEITIPRDGEAKLNDGTRVQFAEFQANFRLGGGEQADDEEGTYNNPAATLMITPPGGAPQKAFAFNPVMAENAPIAKRPVAGHTYRLIDFEKVPDIHILSIQKDPGSPVFYAGGALLGLTLSAVFFFSHKRIWAVVEEKGGTSHQVLLGGDTNRNLFALEDMFKKLIAAITGEPAEVKES